MPLASVTRTRRTQEERSTATRAQLLAATLECLSELGYARTTTIEIARRAGLSRGAQLHHFPTKTELVVAAIEHLFDRRHAEFRTRLTDVPADVDRLDAAIDLLWGIVSGRDFDASLELFVAARTDSPLRAALLPFAQRFRDTVQETFRELFGDRLPSGPASDVAPQFAFALMEGLALGRIMSRPDESEKSIAILKLLAQWIMPRSTRETP